MSDSWTCPDCGFHTDSPGRAREHHSDCAQVQRLKEFIETACNAAAEYDCGFIESTFGEDEIGVFAQTMMLSEEELEDEVGDQEMPKLRLVSANVGHKTYHTVVLVEWLDDRADSLCLCPHDLMAVFYA